MELKIPAEDKDIVTTIRYQNNKLLLQIVFAKKYDDKQVTIPFNYKKFQYSCKILEDTVNEVISNISKEDYIRIENIICTNTLNEFGSVDIENDIFEDKLSSQLKKKKELVVNKYSQNRRSSLYEAVLVNDEPSFVILADSKQTMEFVKSIEESSRRLVPPTIDEYLSEPFTFQSKEEIYSYLERAKKETISTLYIKAKSIVSKYIDQESHIVNLISINIVSSYFQDRFSTVHYIGIFGGNGNGKSSIGDAFEALSYRPYNTTDPTPANIFRSLGNVEPGQITLVLDESERIDQNPDMMSILKTGYDIRKTVSRVNQYTGKPEKFNTYCQKVIIGERPPSPVLAKGVNDRILGDIVYYGNPQYDIKEVLNPTDTGDEELKGLLSEITEFRKTLFAFRLLHFRDHISNISLEISGRDKELVKPYLQLFSKFKTEEEKHIYEEIKITFAKLLEIKNEKTHSTLEYALIPLALILMEQSKTKTIKFSDLWNLLQYHIKGKLNEYKPNEYNTEEYGTIYRNTITNTLNKIGVRTKHQNSFTELLFDKKKIKKTVSQYGFVIQEKIDDMTSERSERSERYVDSSSEKNNNAEDNKDEIEPINQHVTAQNGLDFCQNDENHNTSKQLDGLKNEDTQGSAHSPHSTHPTTYNALKSNLYRIGNTDTIGCNDCKMKDDRWFMNDHPCSGNLSRK